MSERSKLVQPLERSVVKRILVRDGDHVTTGQALVELDPTSVSADLATVRQQRQAALSERLRAASLLQALRGQQRGTGKPRSRTPCSTEHGPIAGEHGIRWVFLPGYCSSFALRAAK